MKTWSQVAVSGGLLAGAVVAGLALAGLAALLAGLVHCRRRELAGLLREMQQQEAEMASHGPRQYAELFASTLPTVWIRELVAWRRGTSWLRFLGLGAATAAGDEQLRRLTRLCVVHKKTLGELPASIRRDLCRELDSVAALLPDQNLRSLLVFLDRVGYDQTSIDVISPVESAKAAEEALRANAGALPPAAKELKEAYDRSQRLAGFASLLTALGLPAPWLANPRERPPLTPPDLTFAIFAHDRWRGEDREQGDRLLCLLHRHYGPAMRLRLAAVDQFLLAKGELVQTLAAAWEQDLCTHLAAQDPAWRSFLDSFRRTPFAALEADLVADFAALNERYFQLLLRYQPGSYEQPDRDERTREVIAAWSLLERLHEQHQL